MIRKASEDAARVRMGTPNWIRLALGGGRIVEIGHISFPLGMDAAEGRRFCLAEASIDQTKQDDLLFEEVCLRRAAIPDSIR